MDIDMLTVTTALLRCMILHYTMPSERRRKFQNSVIDTYHYRNDETVKVESLQISNVIVSMRHSHPDRSYFL